MSLGGLLRIKSELLSRIGTTSRLTSARDTTGLKLELDATESGLRRVAIPSARMSRTTSDSDKHQTGTATRTKTQLLVVSRNGSRCGRKGSRVVDLAAERDRRCGRTSHSQSGHAVNVTAFRAVFAKLRSRHRLRKLTDPKPLKTTRFAHWRVRSRNGIMLRLS